MVRLFLLVFVFVLVNVCVSEYHMIRVERKYNVKVRKGRIKLYEGKVDCYFERNRELDKLRFGSIKKSGYHVELEEIGVEK